MDTAGHIDSGELPHGSHHTQPKLFSQFLFQTQTISLRLQGALKMIARLSLAVFYIITRKLLGAFYVDQKKKGLLPSTLPSEHEQWGISLTDEYGHAWVIFPISFSWAQPIVIPVHYGVNTVWYFVESTQLKKDTAEIVIKNNDGSTKKNQGCAWIAIAK